jgi:hypothetical protein
MICEPCFNSISNAVWLMVVVVNCKVVRWEQSDRRRCKPGEGSILLEVPQEVERTCRAGLHAAVLRAWHVLSSSELPPETCRLVSPVSCPARCAG